MRALNSVLAAALFSGAASISAAEEAGQKTSYEDDRAEVESTGNDGDKLLLQSRVSFFAHGRDRSFKRLVETTESGQQSLLSRSLGVLMADERRHVEGRDLTEALLDYVKAGEGDEADRQLLKIAVAADLIDTVDATADPRDVARIAARNVAAAKAREAAMGAARESARAVSRQVVREAAQQASQEQARQAVRESIGGGS